LIRPIIAQVDEEKKKGKVAPPPGSSSIGLELQSSLTLRDMTCEKLDLHLKVICA
jgi:hypothetical protein